MLSQASSQEPRGPLPTETARLKRRRSATSVVLKRRTTRSSRSKAAFVTREMGTTVNIPTSTVSVLNSTTLPSSVNSNEPELQASGPCGQASTRRPPVDGLNSQSKSTIGSGSGHTTTRRIPAFSYDVGPLATRRKEAKCVPCLKRDTTESLQRRHR